MKQKILIVLIFFLAFFTRTYLISKYPVSLSMDEVAEGFNAYSILTTGKDEFGEVLPLTFKSAGDYKPPVNTYLIALSIKVFGLSEFAVRFPAAILGALTAVFLVFLLKEMGMGKGAYFSGFWLSILPWHIHFSRGFDAVIALFFLVVGTWAFVKWIRKKKALLLILSAASFSLSVWTYHSERLFTPILVIFLILLFRKGLILKKKVIRQVVLALLVVAFFAIPFLKLALFTPAIKERAVSTSILYESSLSGSLHRGNYENLTEKILNNDIYLVFRHWAGKYINYFDLRFWFWKGLYFTPPGYPDLGLLYAIDIPLMAFGVYALVKSKNEKLKKLALFWFFAGPIPASLTMNEQHPLRALTWIPFFAIVVSAGFEYLLTKIKKRQLILGYALLSFVSLVYFFDIYFHHFPRYFSEYWGYPFKGAAEYACRNWDSYEEILLTDTFGSLGPANNILAYLYMLFYCDKDREAYLKTGDHSQKMIFRRPELKDFEVKEKMLLIGSPWDFQYQLAGRGKIIDRLYFASGQEALLMVEP